MISHPVFASFEQHISLSDQDKQYLAEHLVVRSLSRGELFVKEGGVSRSTYFVSRGSVRGYFVDLEGEEHIIQLAIEGWWISDLKFFVDQKNAITKLQALEPAEVVEIPYDTLQQIYRQVPQMERFFRIIIQNAYVSFQLRVLSNLSMTAEERYDLFMEKYPLLARRLPQKYIASYLGMTPEFLSRMKKRKYLRGRE